MPIKGSKTTPQVRFAKHIEIDPVTHCHVWTGSLSSQGSYPTFTDANGKIVYAYRAIWEMVHGEIPDGHEIHHKCGRTDHLCCNVSHLVCLTSEEHDAIHAAEREARYNARIPWVASLVRLGFDSARIKKVTGVPMYLVTAVRRQLGKTHGQ